MHKNHYCQTQSQFLKSAKPIANCPIALWNKLQQLLTFVLLLDLQILVNAFFWPCTNNWNCNGEQSRQYFKSNYLLLISLISINVGIVHCLVSVVWYQRLSPCLRYRHFIKPFPSECPSWWWCIICASWSWCGVYWIWSIYCWNSIFSWVMYLWFCGFVVLRFCGFVVWWFFWIILFFLI